MQQQTTIGLKNFLAKGSHEEGAFTKALEKQTVRIPSGGFLSLALGAMAVSLGLGLFSRRKDPGAFAGLWVPTLLLFGIYNKIVKVEVRIATTSKSLRSRGAWGKSPPPLIYFFRCFPND